MRGWAKAVIAIVVVAGLAAACAWVLWWSAIFGVRDVQVVGATTVDAAGVVAAAAIPPQTPLIRVSRSEVEERVLADPRIATATVELDWPDTVVIAVSERRAVACVRTATGWAVLDRDGVAFLDVPSKPAGLPELRATGAGQPAALAVADDLPEALAGQVASISATTGDDVSLTLLPGTPGSSIVLWGSAEQNARKAEVLSALLPRKASVYNVMAPDQPSVSGTPTPLPSASGLN